MERKSALGKIMRRSWGGKMGKFSRILWVLIIASFVVLSGCTDEVSTDKELEGEDVGKKEENIESIDGVNKEEEEIVEEVKPIVVDVVDPNTQEIVRTILPEEMGFGIKNDQYMAELKAWAKDLARGTETTVGYDTKMVPDKIGPDGEIIKGSPRVILDESALVEKVISASVNGGTVELPIELHESGYKIEEVPLLDEVVIASYTTYFNSGVAGRTRNIELSAEAINNVIVGVGDVFSFNTTVGERTVDRGYQEAPEAVNGKLVNGIGGGICQTSSTLFNAIDKIGVTYVEKHHHSVSVGYVPTGRDATVSWGGPDFRFQNTTNVPVLLKAYVEGGALTVEIRTSKENAAEF